MMDSKDSHSCRRLSGWTCCLAACLLPCWPRTVSGQETTPPASPYPDQSTVSNAPALPLTPPPPVQPATPGNGLLGNPLLGTSALGGFAVPPQASIPSTPGLVHEGPLNVYPRLLYQFAYGNAIQSVPGQRSDSAINTVSPGLLTTWRNNWSLLFTPSMVFYSAPACHNVTDYTVSLNGGASYGAWTFTLAQGYSQTDEPLVETGSQTGLEAYTTALEGVCQMNTHFSLKLGLNQTIRYLQAAAGVQGLSDLHEWSTSDWLNYQAGPAFGAGLGVILGYDQVSQSSDMPFEQFQGRISYALGKKLSFILSGGVEDRQFIDPSAPPLISPVFSGLARYQPFSTTTFSLQAARTVTPSFFANQIVTSTSVTAGWQQRLLKRLNLAITGAYATQPYTSIEPGALPKYYFGLPPASTLQVTRNDTSSTGSFSLSYAIRQRLKANVFYNISRFDSSQSNFAFFTSQVGFSLDYSY